MSLDSLSCIHGPQPTSFYFHPKDGKWTLRNVYETMLACEESDVLRGVFQAPCAEGGFAWPGTPESNQAYPKNIRSTVIYNDPRQIRTYGVFGEHANDWRQLPSHPRFDTPMDISGTYQRGKATISAIQCRSKINPTIRMCVELMRIIQRQGHFILATEGFKDNQFSTIITPKRIHNLITAKEIRQLQARV